MPSPPPDSSAQPLVGHLVVFTGRLTRLGRKHASALVMRLGGSTSADVSDKTTWLVAGVEGAVPSTETTDKLRRVTALNGTLERPIEVLTEEQFCHRAGVPTPELLRSQFYAMRDLLARYRLLREDHMRYLVKCSIITPVLRTSADTFFAFQDVAAIKQANDDLAEGLSFQTAVRTLISRCKSARRHQSPLPARSSATPCSPRTTSPLAQRSTTATKPLVSKRRPRIGVRSNLIRTWWPR